MHWNHRVMAHTTEEGIWFEIHEVYYEDEIPQSYTNHPVSASGDTITGMKFDLKNMLGCLDKPILWHGKRFPKEYDE